MSSSPSFESYQWEEDEEWLILIRKLEFPGSFDKAKKERHILKRKQKYYKEKIDPSFEPILKSKQKAKAEPSPTAASTESNPHDPNAASSESTSSTTDSTQHSHSEQKQQPSNASNASNASSSSSSSGPSAGSYGSYSGYQPPPTKLGQIIAPFLNYYYLISQCVVLICCIASLFSGVFYYRALYGTIIMYLINTFQTNGRPQLNMYYAQRVMQDENIMIAVYGAIFLMGNPVFVFLIPIMLRSLYMSTYLLNGLLGAKIPSLYHQLRPLMQKILTRRGWFNETIALAEVYVGIFLIFACFFMSKTVILTFIYWQIMHARYMMSRMIQFAFSVIHNKIQSILSRVPFVLNLYLKLATYLWNMVDPQRLQQQMQNSQGAAAGAASGISKYCTIM